MVTPGLWRRLLTPPRLHPIFVRINGQPPPQVRIHPTVRGVLGVLVLLAAWWLLPSTIDLLADNALFLPFLLTCVVNLRAGVWTMDIGAFASREHERGTWDLLSLTPEGAAGVRWLTGAAVMYRNNALHGLAALLNGITPLALVLVYGVALVVAFNLDPGRANTAALDLPPAFLIEATTLIALLYADAVQTVVLALVAGAVAAEGKRRDDARLVALVIFASVQLVLYLLGVGVGYGVLPGVLARVGLDANAAALVGGVVRFVLVCGLREVLILAFMGAQDAPLLEAVADESAAR